MEDVIARVLDSSDADFRIGIYAFISGDIIKYSSFVSPGCKLEAFTITDLRYCLNTYYGDRDLYFELV